MSSSDLVAQADHAAERRALRKQVRAQRREFPPDARAAADAQILRRILALPAFRAAHNVAVYFAFDGEPSLAKLMRLAERRGKRLFAPVISAANMHFAPIDRSARLNTNFFGISEPRNAQPFDARQLDLVLAPLVAFDEYGTRIGVGRGYYDRAFEFLRHRTSWLRPRLVGVAYSFQCMPRPLHRSNWDIPLSGAVTEARTYRFTTDAAP